MARLTSANGSAAGGVSAATSDLVARLTESSDPTLAYRSRVLAGALDPESEEAHTLRAAIADSPRSRALLSHREPNGTILLHPYAKWQGPHWTLVSLALLDYPAGDPTLLPLRDQVYEWLFSRAHLHPPGTVIYPDQPERVRRCASQEGNAVWSSLRLGLEDERTLTLVERLIGWQWPDGGWNCDKRPTARHSSFQETAIPLRALWVFGMRHGHAGALAAADRAAELLLSRRLLWRRRDATLIWPDWGGPVDQIHFPFQFYDVLFALRVLTESGRAGDPRMADARALLVAKCLPDGGFPREDYTAMTRERVASRGTFADWGPTGRRTSNPFVTLAAWHVLRTPSKGRPAEVSGALRDATGGHDVAHRAGLEQRCSSRQRAPLTVDGAALTLAPHPRSGWPRRREQPWAWTRSRRRSGVSWS